MRTLNRGDQRRARATGLRTLAICVPGRALVGACLALGAALAAVFVVIISHGFGIGTRESHAQNWVVAEDGSDAKDGRSPREAFRTISRALTSAEPGDRISVGPGTYSPFVVSVADVDVSGSAGAIVIGAAGQRDGIQVAASGVTISGLEVRGCVPNPAPSGGLVHDASAGVRVGPDVTKVTLNHLTVHDSHGVSPERLPFGCIGIALQDVTDSTVSDSNVFHNGEGIEVDGGGSGDVIAGNITHDNDTLVANTVYPDDDDWGAVGIGLTDTVGVTVRGNTAYNNFGPSHDWGTDGGAFEIYQSSHIAITGNIAYNNDDVLETGASGSADCDDNIFAGNTVSGRTAGSKLQASAGLILRCAHDMAVTDNTIRDVDWWAFWVYQRQPDGHNGGTIGGLAIIGNRVAQTSAEVYSLGAEASRPNITIADNSYQYKQIFATSDGQEQLGIAAWRDRTGFDR